MDLHMSKCALLAAVLLAGCLSAADISVAAGQAVLKSSSLERIIRFGDGNIQTTSFAVGGRQMLASPAREFSVVFTREASNQRPRGLRPG